MTGIIYNINRFAVHDGPGIRTTVFFKGCPLRCGWCHNPESIDQNPCSISKVYKLNGRNFAKEETIGYPISAELLFAEIEKDRIFMDESGGGVTFSGGEPLLQSDFLMNILKICKENGIHTAVDTSLYASWEKIESLSAYIDLFLADLKLIDGTLHRTYTGVSNGTILANFRKLPLLETPVIVRIPVIPNVTDTKENIVQSISFLQSLTGKIREIHLLPFHNIAGNKYIQLGRENLFVNQKSLNKKDLQDIEKQFRDAGFIVRNGG